MGITQAQLSRIENGPPMVHLDRLIQIARLFSIPPNGLWFTCPEHSAVTGIAAAPIPSPDRGSQQLPSPLLDSPLDVIQRMRAIAATTVVDQHTFTELHAVVADAIDDYERLGPAVIAPTLVEQRRYLHLALIEGHPPRIALRLFTLAAQMSGVLASVAVDLRSERMARSYASEAFQLADMVDDPDLSAWIRATQSLIEYYAGRYDIALGFARDGLRIAPSGPQTIRLTVNGEARALARLGDRKAADAAVDRAIQLHEDLPDPPEPCVPGSQDVSSSLTLGPYCSARIHGNAATTYLLLRDPGRVLSHGEQALRAFDRGHLQGPRALTRLDMATAWLHADHLDPARAARLAEDALAIDAAAGFASVTHRAREFLAVAAPYGDIPKISRVRQTVRDFTARAPTATIQEGLPHGQR
jgi:tetratricopeptide (TPR) repeat protein